MEPIAPADIADPSWIEFWGFVVGTVGTFASVVIAMAAIILSARAGKANTRRAAADKEERLRARRESFATDFILWIRSGAAHLMTARELVVVDAGFISAGEALSARARVLGEDSASNYMVALRDATEEMKKVPVEKRFEVTKLVNGLLESSIAKWVDDPTTQPPPLLSWVEVYSKPADDNP